VKKFGLIIAEDLNNFSTHKNQRNMIKRRTAVFIVPSQIVGHDLIFRHYTNKVVVGKYVCAKMPGVTEQVKDQKVRWNPGK
jgi:hypothetical protein